MFKPPKNADDWGIGANGTEKITHKILKD